MSMSIESIQVVSLILQRSEGLLHHRSPIDDDFGRPPSPRRQPFAVRHPVYFITFDRLHDPSFKLQPLPLSVQILIEKSLAINVDVLMDSPQIQVNILFVFDVVHTALAVVDPLLQAITKLTSMLTNYTEFVTNPTTHENATATGMPKPCVIQLDEDEIFEGESVRVERQTVEIVPPPSSIDTETIADVAKQIVSQFNAPARISLAVKDITVHVFENAHINRSYALSISTSLGADIVLQPPMVVNHEKEKTAEHLAFLAGFSQLFPQFDLLYKTGHGIKGVQITRFREVKEDVAGALIVSTASSSFVRNSNTAYLLIAAGKLVVSQSTFTSSASLPYPLVFAKTSGALEIDDFNVPNLNDALIRGQTSTTMNVANSKFESITRATTEGEIENGTMISAVLKDVSSFELDTLTFDT
ncbi:hypothetical protein BLNAU_2218 [Blattamonas nauphoetae]|uniref:Uncharacterized protein n=1 Tax=Blattamonas nauphoetae TaxID=2049346 RepID=A0ABQ9WXR4_9EUKA|nr:hypothetical protein BLNAU_20790 [Blattamonas nauphoetae]KAK2948183.1 hypothetical protein BLNAU_16892 [Blattamonas nauphoetae]KAK2962783.1 hypothetical protein BLNAU_2218 [Blattamonas nauphoetae]